MKRSNSYTLLEILIALSIATVLSLLSIPFFSQTNHDLIVHELHHLFSLFSYLQQQAMATNQTITLNFNIEHQSLQYPNTHQKDPGQKTFSTYQLPKHLLFGAPERVMGPPANPTKPIIHPVSFGLSSRATNPHLQFHPNGYMSSGTLYLADRSLSHVGALTCSVGAVSYIRTYYYNHGTWTILNEQ